MPAFFVALRESVHDPEEMQLYADKAAGSAAGHRFGHEGCLWSTAHD